MTRGQFEILLSRLDTIDERLREVEMFQAGAKAVRRSRHDDQLDIKWRLGIVGSLVGALITVISKLTEMLSSTTGGK